MTVLRQVVAAFEDVRLYRSDQSLLYGSGMSSEQGDRAFFFSILSHLSSAGAERLYQGYERDFLWALTGDDAGKNVSRNSSR